MRWRPVGACVAALLLGVAGPGCQEGDTITAPALSATCEARPSTGLAPLTLAFLLSVAGAEGPFTISTATQSSRCSTAVTALPSTVPSPPPGSNRRRSPSFKSTPDAVGSRAGVRLRGEQPALLELVG